MYMYFRKLVYIVHIIEFQHRGLPHAYIVLKILLELLFAFINTIVIVRILNNPEFTDVHL